MYSDGWPMAARPGSALIETAEGILRAPAVADCPEVSTGKPAPIDGVTTDLTRPAVASDAARARRLGFGGKLCIHPAQVPEVNQAFAPDQTEIAWARRIVAAAAGLGGAGAGRVDGQMIDKPVIDRARRILSAATATATEEEAEGPEAADSPATAAELPLAGVTVVALEQAVAAPFATRQLADLGARVIKIERPGEGDFARGYDRTVLGQASYFVWLNRGKESVELDIKTDQGRAQLDAILARADVFVQNLAPGAADRAGSALPTCRRAIPA